MSTNKELFIILEQVDSTNNYAMQQVHAGKATHGDAWFAIEQTSGKGRRGRQWLMQKGENIILTVAVNTTFLKLYEQFQISVAAALACYDLFRKYDPINTKIKWPNDLFWNDRKAGGILIENIVKGNIWQWSVIGLGLNINQTGFPFFEKNEPVSLKQITGEKFDIIELGKKLHNNLLKRFAEIKNHNFVTLLAEYNNVLYKRNEKVKLKMKNIIFETIISGVSPLGQLQTFDSMEHNFSFDEVEWML